ncbi:pyridoxamine 5'-phosphate oxidase family protein [Streptomyces sp. Da 82-17]|uniref:pyridoxamine 5'-phosphate oxidase family protein n=1 Tax=Streptomyces sp. Da 82-17 TaxID=3377116 RepID=UPI0038D413E3
MPQQSPRTDLDPRYSSADAQAVPWSQARERIERAEVFWLSTVRPDGRPHVTPLIAVWQEGALHFTTGEQERKARNLAENREVVLTTGSGALDAGYDVVVEGTAERVTDEPRLRALAAAWAEKYGEVWSCEVTEGGFRGANGLDLVYSVVPRTAFGFGKGELFSQTRWRF